MGKFDSRYSGVGAYNLRSAYVIKERDIQRRREIGSLKIALPAKMKKGSLSQALFPNYHTRCQTRSLGSKPLPGIPGAWGGASHLVMLPT
jgi:hypothetical protein